VGWKKARGKNGKVRAWIVRPFELGTAGGGVDDRRRAPPQPLVQPAENPDQCQDRQRNAQQPEKKIASHVVSYVVVNATRKRALEREVPSDARRNEVG
jgi:hypothetical protein